MAFLDNLMGGIFGSSGGKTQDILKSIGDKTQKYFNPYIDAGKSALPDWQKNMLEMSQDPSGFLNALGGGYQQSPGFQFSVDQATKAAMNAAAASGMAGSPAVQDALAKQITGYANQDYNNWMQQALGVNQQGNRGLQDISGMGLQAGTSFSQILQQAMQAQAQAEAARAQSQASASGGLLGGIIGMFT